MLVSIVRGARGMSLVAASSCQVRLVFWPLLVSGRR